MRGLTRMIQTMHPVLPGQIVITADTTLIVPAGVFAVSAVCRQRGTVAGEAWAGVAATRIVRAGVDVVRAQNGNRLGDGGGDGGMSGARVSATVEDGAEGFLLIGGGGGGGAGGYSGAGGAGGNWVDERVGGTNSDWIGKAGAGGGGGGGICGARNYGSGGGGGGGLLGTGTNGAGGNAWPSSAGAGSGGAAGAATPTGYATNFAGVPGSAGGLYGGAQGDHRSYATYAARGRGGACAWKNDIPVYPGEVLQIFVAGNGGVRILWGGGRSYPSNAGNL